DTVLQFLSNQPKELKQTAKKLDDSAENDAILQSKIDAACNHLQVVQTRWQQVLDNLDSVAINHQALLSEEVISLLNDSDTLFNVLQRRDLRISYRKEVEKPLKELFQRQA